MWVREIRFIVVLNMFSELAHKCDLCHGAFFKRIAEAGGVSLHRCEDCGLVVCLPLPESAQRVGIYSAPNYFEEHVEAVSPARIGHSARDLREIRRLVPPPANLLEVGCATGSVLKAAKLAGYQVTGVEISPFAASIARNELGLNVFNCELKDAPLSEASFDMVLAFHVLEHVPSPSEFLTLCAKLLRPKGVLTIEVPDFASWPARRLLTRWVHFKPMEHIHYFERDSLTKLLACNGFEVTRVQKDGLTSVFQLWPFHFQVGRQSNQSQKALDQTRRHSGYSLVGVKRWISQIPFFTDFLKWVIYGVVPINDFIRIYALKK